MGIIESSRRNIHPEQQVSGHVAIVVGTSSGGLSALKVLLPPLPADFALPIVVVQHIGSLPEATGWPKSLNDLCKVFVKEADEKERMLPGTVYTAPANYHLLIERDSTFTFTIDERVNYARPSIDVLFESASDAFGERLIGILLTGANNDGAMGMKKIKESGGLTIVQDPETAEMPTMPQSAIEVVVPDYILSLEGISMLLQHIHINRLNGS